MSRLVPRTPRWLPYGLDARRLARGATVLLVFGLAQVGSQILTLVAGIAVVRFLAVEQYALYTIANGMMSAVYLLAESGIASAAVGIGGRSWQDGAWLGGVLAAARRRVLWLRNLTSLPVGAVLVWLLLRNGAGALDTAILVLLVLAGGSLSLLGQIYVVAPRLRADTGAQQRAAVAASAFRLGATLAAAALGLLASTAVLAIVLGGLLYVWLLRRWMRGRVALDASVDAGVERELRAVVARQLPNGIYYLCQSQIGIWLLSVFASTDSVAHLGAVTRISAILGVMMATMQGVIVPRYARVQAAERLMPLFFLVMLGFAAVAALLVAAVWMLPEPLIWLLGPQYAGLPAELVLASAAAAITAVGALAWMLSANRGWFLPAWVNIPVGVTTQAVAIATIGVATLRQVLWLGICTELVFLLLNLGAGVYFLRRFRRRSVL